jgi:hypothetical protein
MSNSQRSVDLRRPYPFLLLRTLPRLLTASTADMQLHTPTISPPTADWFVAYPNQPITTSPCIVDLVI